MKEITFVPPSEIRAEFSRRMSDMYRSEVPLYGDLLELVTEVNHLFLERRPLQKEVLAAFDSLERVSEERHGAIRLGTTAELRGIRLLFDLMGMEAVGYYDLCEAGIPVHSTAFRPVGREELSKNPFRVFTSLLRLELIEDEDLRQEAEEILNRRRIFTDRALTLVAEGQRQGGLTESQARECISEALETFRWREEALISEEIYVALHRSHPLVADIVSFHGPHINHLTPRALDIDLCQKLMPERGIVPKAIIEGPPRRAQEILLRQTSFQALRESIHFLKTDGRRSPGTHKARFGEIEQRGAALTPAGRDLYDRLLRETRAEIIPLGDGSNASEYDSCLRRVFETFPDQESDLLRQDLAYFEYRLKDPENRHDKTSIEALLDADLVNYSPVTYEDFLPVSAAGIFRSNLNTENIEDQTAQPASNQTEFERQLGIPIQNPFRLYRKIRDDSVSRCVSFRPPSAVTPR